MNRLYLPQLRLVVGSEHRHEFRRRLQTREPAERLAMIERLREQLEPKLADHRAAVASVRAERKALKDAERRTQATAEAQALLQEVAQSVQRVVHARVAGVVSRCLEAVWGEDAYTFKIDFEQKRGRTEAAISLVRDGNEVHPLDGAGGGVADIVSFALRVAAMMLKRPKVRRLLVLDEPFRHLSHDLRPAARAMIKSLADDMGFQLLLVTHSREIAVGKVIEMG